MKSRKLERIQRKFVALRYNQFSSPDNNGYNYANALKLLNLRTFLERRCEFDAILVINIFLSGSNSYPSSMGIISFRIPNRNLQELPLFHVSTSFKNCPSVRCATLPNSICSNFYVFRMQSITLSRI